MQSNIEKYKSDLDQLIKKGQNLFNSLFHECHPDEFKEAVGRNADQLIESLPDFGSEYQSWYSESKVLIKLLLPDRIDDFVRLYEKPKSRKSNDITYESYRIEDCLQGLNVTSGYEKQKVVGPDAAIPHVRQQLAILKSVKKRFESTLFDIKQLVQADLFDSEVEVARELLKKGFIRAAGAIAGVVLEKHLIQVKDNHRIKTRKKNLTISVLNDLLKENNVIDTPIWRQIQHLGDIRNLCDHKKERDPTKQEVSELITGVAKFTKTLY